MSAGGYLDGCSFIPASAGTGDFVVSAAVKGYQTPGSAGAAAIVYTYRAESADKSQWEIGFGAYTIGTTTLARTTVLASSTGSKVSFTAAPNVYITSAQADLQNASLLNSGTVPTARLGSGTASASTALFGDQTYKTLAAIAQSGSASDITTGSLSPSLLSLSQIAASLGADLALSTSYTDGPSISQGSTGTWWVSGTVSMLDTTVASTFSVKLYDGTNLIASTRVSSAAANFLATATLSGFKASPAGNLRIAVLSSATGVLKFNSSGLSKDCSISAFRIN